MRIVTSNGVMFFRPAVFAHVETGEQRTMPTPDAAGRFFENRNPADWVRL